MGPGRWKDFDVCISSPTIPDCLIHCLRPVIRYASIEIYRVSFRFNGMQPLSTVRVIHFPNAIDTPYSLVGGYYALNQWLRWYLHDHHIAWASHFWDSESLQGQTHTLSSNLGGIWCSKDEIENARNSFSVWHSVSRSFCSYACLWSLGWASLTQEEIIRLVLPV